MGKIRFDAIAKLPANHLQRGIEVSKLLTGRSHRRIEGVTPDILRRTARIAADAGVLIFQSVNRTSGGPKSRRISRTIVTATADQHIKIKEAPMQLARIVRESVERQ